MASSVTWTKDEEPVEIDGTKTQYVIDRAASTYDNVLTVIAEPGETAGNYCCSVINAVGSASRCVEVTGKTVLTFTQLERKQVTLVCARYVRTLVNIIFIGFHRCTDSSSRLAASTVVVPQNLYPCMHKLLTICHALVTQ